MATKHETPPAAGEDGWGEVVAIAARRGKAAFVPEGARIQVVNTHGTQVVDCWAFNADNPVEFLSMEHCRVSLGRYRPAAGDRLVTNLRRPILHFIEDTSPGVHDTLMAACDLYRYRLLGFDEHRNCTDNLWEALAALGYKPAGTPCPFNLWQNTPVEPDGSIGFRPTVSKRGDHVVFRAEMDLVLCLSACPQDVLPINSRRPRGAHFRIEARPQSR